MLTLTHQTAVLFTAHYTDWVITN